MPNIRHRIARSVALTAAFAVVGAGLTAMPGQTATAHAALKCEGFGGAFMGTTRNRTQTTLKRVADHHNEHGYWRPEPAESLGPRAFDKWCVGSSYGYPEMGVSYELPDGQLVHFALDVGKRGLRTSCSISTPEKDASGPNYGCEAEVEDTETAFYILER